MGTSAGACDGYPCVFFNTMAWYDDHSPLPVSVNPQVTFERMFGDPGTPEQRLARLHQKQSMLDSVMGETKRLQHMIGAKDNAILDEYLTNIRRVEEQLQKMEARSSALATASDAPVGIPEDFDEHMTVTYDLLHLAFQGDITRVFSFMLGHEASGRSYAHIGIKEPHHSTSHHRNTPDSLDQYARIGAYHMVKLAQFIEKLKSTPDGDGTLLDSSLVYFGARHEQRLAARPAQRACRADRPRQRPPQGQPAHRGHEGRADVEPVGRDGRQARSRGRVDRREHRAHRDLEPSSTLSGRRFAAAGSTCGPRLAAPHRSASTLPILLGSAPRGCRPRCGWASFWASSLPVGFRCEVGVTIDDRPRGGDRGEPRLRVAHSPRAARPTPPAARRPPPAAPCDGAPAAFYEPE